jgi:hypothetical protein
MNQRLVGFGCIVSVVIAIGSLVLFISGSWRWLIIVPLLLLLLMLVSPLFPFSKRTITPQQFADELERHLLGTERGMGLGRSRYRNKYQEPAARQFAL